MLRSEKVQSVEEIKGHLARVSSAVFLDYSGMTVAEVSQLRDTFREQGVDYKVFKNTLIKRALGDAPYASALANALKGMTAVALSTDEPGAAARVIKTFTKDNAKLKVKAGLLDGQVLDAATVHNQLASLPSRDEARAMLLATFMAPAQQFVMLLNTPASSLVRLLKAREQQAETGSP